MKISLIITTFNRPDALLIVLQSIERQSQIPYEVIIADDGSDDKTKKIIADFSDQSKLKIIHSFQEDKGFRAAMSRNRGISKASGDYIVLIDGDMALHRNFISDHERNAQVGYFVQGTRVLLSRNKTKEILENYDIPLHFFSTGLKNRKNSFHSNILSELFSIKKNYLSGLKTCNVGFFKKDCISINGFNNKFEGWGREDSEFFARLMNKGILRKTLRFNSIQYHLWHHEASRESLIKNDELLQKTINNNLDWCEIGIDQYL
jgi:glycosyltransferase involved in cell wall biosynthesis